jgi:hypothetical protein
MIFDLDEHILRCRPGPSKSYAEEALAAYRAGAYRSSIVTTWIAVVFNIIEKMREAALFENAEIKQKLIQFEQWQEQVANGNKSVLKQALEFERDILDYAHKKLEFIDAHQLLDLNRLQEDRNRCEHPTLQRDGVPLSTDSRGCTGAPMSCPNQTSSRTRLVTTAKRGQIEPCREPTIPTA